MGKPDGAHTHGHGGGGLGLNGAADVLNRYVLLPIAAVVVVASFLHFILIALLCIGAFVFAAGVGFVAARVYVVRRARRLYGLPAPRVRGRVMRPARPVIDGQEASQLDAGAELRRAITRALIGRDRIGGPR